MFPFSCVIKFFKKFSSFGLYAKFFFGGGVKKLSIFIRGTLKCFSNIFNLHFSRVKSEVGL